MVCSQTTTCPSICIFGASGIQGGSVLAHLLASPKAYRIRAVTRDPLKVQSREMASKGIEVVKADMASSDDMCKALDGMDYCFAVTNFWEHGAERELADGKRLMDCALKCKVKCLFWSGLVDVSTASKGRYDKVHHFDTKARILAYGQSKKVPICNVMAAGYMSNFQTILAPKKQQDGSFAFVLPISASTRYNLIDASRDYGAFVRGAIEYEIEDNDTIDGTEVMACGDVPTVGEMIQQWSEATGKKATLEQVDGSTYASMASEEMAQMHMFFADFGYYGGRDCTSSLKMLPENYKCSSWMDFCKATDWSSIVS